MLRHLGAAYYDSLQGRATQADVTRAVDTVAEHLNEQAQPRQTSRLLPVVDEQARLVGVVSRRDLLALFLRPDEDIAADVRKVLDEILLAEPGEADVAVRDGIVTLTGTLDPTTGAHGDLIPVAIRLMWDVDGVVDIIDKLGQPRPVPRTPAAPPAQAS